MVSSVIPSQNDAEAVPLSPSVARSCKASGYDADASSPARSTSSFTTQKSSTPNCAISSRDVASDRAIPRSNPGPAAQPALQLIARRRQDKNRTDGNLFFTHARALDIDLPAPDTSPSSRLLQPLQRVAVSMFSKNRAYSRIRRAQHGVNSASVYEI